MTFTQSLHYHIQYKCLSNWCYLKRKRKFQTSLKAIYHRSPISLNLPVNQQPLITSPLVLCASGRMSSKAGDISSRNAQTKWSDDMADTADPKCDQQYEWNSWWEVRVQSAELFGRRISEGADGGRIHMDNRGGGRESKDPLVLPLPPSGCHVHTNLTEKDQAIGNRSLWGQGSQVKGSSQHKASRLDGLLMWDLEG